MSGQSERVAIGAIVRAHGVRGWLRVRAFNRESPALASARHLLLGPPGAGPGGLRQIAVERCERERDEWLVKLRGVDDRDAAEALRGQEVVLPRADLPAAADGELYVADLVGCAVVDLAGAAIGAVTSTVNYGAQELLVVARPGGPPGAEALIPFVAPIVIDVDLAGRRIVCDPPEGLLDLAAAAGERPPADSDEGGAGDGDGGAP